MKSKTVKLKMAAALIVLAAGSINSFAQVRTVMYVMKNGAVVFQSPVSEIDTLTFDEAASGEALMIDKNDGSPADQILLNQIQQLSFSDDALTVETANSSEVYAFSEIAKLSFGNTGTKINNPPVPNGFDVLVSLTATGDAMVTSTADIRSLTVFSVDGKMISKRQCKDAERQCLVSLQGSPAGVYLLRVETEQGAAVKKIVKPVNK